VFKVVGYLILTAETLSAFLNMLSFCCNIFLSTVYYRLTNVRELLNSGP